MNCRGRLIGLAFAGAFVLVVACAMAAEQKAAPAAPASRSGWTLTWSDEFDGPDGSGPDPAKWVMETGGSGWGNNELEYYTSRRQNVHLEKGDLVIEAIKEKFTGPGGVERPYTSARLKTEARFSQRYGRFEARIRVPSGQGVWPAFWLLGEDFPTAGWPRCGEIDVMENVGKEPATIHGSLHGPGYFGETPLTATYTLAQGRFSDGFHTFAVEWEEGAIRFYVDDVLYQTRTPASLPAGKHWVFDHPFYVILNLAVGGNMPGPPDDSTVFPQRMLVDYVRVYARN